MKAHEYWFSHYGVRRNPGIVFYVIFALPKNNFEKISKIMSDFVSPNTEYMQHFSFRSSARFFFEIFFTLIVEYNGCIIQKFFLPY